MVQAMDKIWNIQGIIQGMIQALVQELQAEVKYLQASLDFGYLVGTPREQASVLLDGEWMDEG